MSADPWEPWLTELEGACDAIRRIVVESAELKSLHIHDLTVTRLRAAEVTVSDSLEVPAHHADGKVS